MEEVVHRPSRGLALGDVDVQPGGLCPYCSFVRPGGRAWVRAERANVVEVSGFLVWADGSAVDQLGEGGMSGPG